MAFRAPALDLSFRGFPTPPKNPGSKIQKKNYATQITFLEEPLISDYMLSIGLLGKH